MKYSELWWWWWWWWRTGGGGGGGGIWRTPGMENRVNGGIIIFVFEVQFVVGDGVVVVVVVEVR